MTEEIKTIISVICAILIMLIMLGCAIYASYITYKEQQNRREYKKNCTDEELKIITRYETMTKYTGRKKTK